MRFVLTARSPRRRPLRAVVATLCGGLLLSATVEARAAASLPQRISEARETAGADAQQAVRALDALRAEAIAAGRLDWRLAVDEAACRVLSDFDAALGVKVADDGLAAAGGNPPQGRATWLRLRACRAGSMIDIGQTEPGGRELEALIADQPAPSDDATAAARAIALLERGVHRSRRGDFAGGQEDLLDACETLRTKAPAVDRDLCLDHLANHYKRVGDLEEALRLLFPLRDAARRRGATYDDSIYTLAIAQVQEQLQQRPQALANYRAAAEMSEQLADRSGMSYAESGIGNVLSAMGEAAAALPHVERSLALQTDANDPKHAAQATLALADILVALDRTPEANAALERVEANVRARAEQPTLAKWALVRSRALSAVGRWKEAYDALAESRRIDDALHAQQLSQQSARMRMQFNRARDAEDLAHLRLLNEQGHQLRRTQALALALFVVLMLASLVVAVQKFRQARRLHDLASTDELTGLPNRRAVLAFLDAALARAAGGTGTVTVLMIDVDHFKRINDTLGHAVGDDVLRHLSRTLAGALRGQDRLGRLGGEEFLAVLPGTSLEHAVPVAERMRAAIAASPLLGAGGRVHFTISIGLAASPAASSSELLARADAALYRAKDDGRNAVRIDGLEASGDAVVASDTSAAHAPADGATKDAAQPRDASTRAAA